MRLRTSPSQPNPFAHTHCPMALGLAWAAGANNLYREMIRWTPNAIARPTNQGPVLGVEFATASVTAPGTESYIGGWAGRGWHGVGAEAGQGQSRRGLGLVGLQI